MRLQLLCAVLAMLIVVPVAAAMCAQPSLYYRYNCIDAGLDCSVGSTRVQVPSGPGPSYSFVQTIPGSGFAPDTCDCWDANSGMLNTVGDINTDEYQCSVCNPVGYAEADSPLGCCPGTIADVNGICQLPSCNNNGVVDLPSEECDPAFTEYTQACDTPPLLNGIQICKLSCTIDRSGCYQSCGAGAIGADCGTLFGVELGYECFGPGNGVCRQSFTTCANIDEDPNGPGKDGTCCGVQCVVGNLCKGIQGYTPNTIAPSACYPCNPGSTVNPSTGVCEPPACVAPTCAGMGWQCGGFVACSTTTYCSSPNGLCGAGQVCAVQSAGPRECIDTCSGEGIKPGTSSYFGDYNYQTSGCCAGTCPDPNPGPNQGVCGAAFCACNFNMVCDAGESFPACPDCSPPQCGNAVCDAGESTGTCPVDCPPPICNSNFICEAGETMLNCPSDCTPPSCNNNFVCEAGENILNCPNDCTPPVCDMDLVCEAGETNANCPSDCPPPVCGNFVCEAPETTGTCPVDCPPPVCNNNFVCEVGETNLNCPNDCPICNFNLVCEAGENNVNCPSDCPPPVCGNFVCEGSETFLTCPVDCPPPVCNNNFFCDPGENFLNCPNDCPSCNFNLVCDPGETVVTCPSDCSAATENTLASCTNGVDDDSDGMFNYDDASPGVAPGQSCNLACSPALCVSDFSAVPYTWQGRFMPSISGMLPLFYDQTAQHPGTPAALRRDPDGAVGVSQCWCGVCDSANGFQWNASSSQCEQTMLPACNALTISIGSFTATASVPTDPGQIVAAVQYSVGSNWPATYRVSYSTDGVASTYEHNQTVTHAPGTYTSSNLSIGLAAGTYTYHVRVSAACTGGSGYVEAFGGPASATINSITAPIVAPLVAVVTPDWNATNVTFTSSFNHNAQANLTLQFGDSTVYGPVTYPAGAQTLNIPHRYLNVAPGTSQPITANLTVYDRANPSLNASSAVTFSLYSLNYTGGTPTGNNTPGNNSLGCALDSCPVFDAGVWKCVSQFACFPSNQTICLPPNVTRDRDFSETACEYSSSTCNAFVWANVTPPGWLPGNQNCCGDDSNEYNATAVFDPTNPAGAACCSAPNMCYTAAGSATGCIVPITENTAAACSDGIDNDCDGDVDVADLGCAANIVEGYVTLSTSQGIQAGTGATVTLGGYNVTTQLVQGAQGYQAYYAFTTIGALQPGTRLVAASMFGYSTETQTVVLATGGSYRIDFTLEPRICNDDCTNRDGYCDSSCIGVGLCQPNSQETRTLMACHPAGAAFGLRPGQEVTLSYDSVLAEAEVGVCCANVPVIRPAPKTLVAPNPAFGSIDTLVKYTTTVVINGKPYRFVVNTW